MLKDLPGAGHTELVAVGEVERAFAPRHVLLLEHHFLRRAVERRRS